MLPVLAWMGLIFAMSADAASGQSSGALTRWLLGCLGLSAPSTALVAQVGFGLRKLAHLSEYAVLACLWAWAWGGPWPSSVQRLLAVAVGCWAYAASDEWHQTWVPQRVGCWTDLWIDSTGAFGALAFGSWWQARRARPWG